MTERDGDALEQKLRATMKTQLRRSMLAIRNALPADARAARSSKLAERVTALDVVANARTIAAYIAMRGEADPTGVLDAARGAGARIVLPRVDRTRGALDWLVHEAGAPLVAGAYGIPEPSAAAIAVDTASIDVVLVPAVALDELGHRVGMGKGFYDRALTDLANACRVGLVFDFQLVAEVPAEAHDLPVDWVVTDARVIDARSARSARTG